MDLNGTSAIVTGGASGLGEATSRELADHGVTVIILDMNADKGEAVAKEVGGAFVQADVTDTDQVQAAVDAATEAVRAERDRIAGLAPVANAARALVAAATVEALHQRAIAEGWAPEALRSALWEAVVKGAKPPSMPAAPAASCPTSRCSDPPAARWSACATTRRRSRGRGR